MVLEAIAKTPNEAADRLLIGLHGWGANAENLAILAGYLPIPEFKLLFPNAPFPHPHAPGGRMWYGFPPNYSFRTDYDFEQQADLRESQQLLKTWLEQVAIETGIPPQRTVIAGFSQGGAMTLDVGLKLPLAGALVLSGYAHSALTPNEALGPVLQVHGRQDSVVPLKAAHTVRDSLNHQAIDFTYREHDMGHEISPLVLQEVLTFCRRLAFS